MFCNDCGAVNPDGAKFCNKCGKAITAANPPNDSPPAASQATPIPMTLPPMGATVPPSLEPDNKVSFWVGAVAMILFLALAFLFLYSQPKHQPISKAVEVAAENASTPPRKREGRLSSDTVGCALKESADKFQTLRSAGDRQAVNLMLLSGLCEMVYSGTRLDMEDVSIFSNSRYRVYGTARSLYVIAPEFE